MAQARARVRQRVSGRRCPLVKGPQAVEEGCLQAPLKEDPSEVALTSMVKGKMKKKPLKGNDKRIYVNRLPLKKGNWPRWQEHLRV